MTSPSQVRSLYVKSFVVPFQNYKDQEYKVALHRYTKTPDAPNTGDIFLFTHAITAHKEQWVPMLEHLWANDDLNISEAWAYDSPNHGDSFHLNKEWIEKDMDSLSSAFTMIYAMRGVLKSGLLPVSESRKLIVVGHSAGTTAIVWNVVRCVEAKEPIPFSLAIIIEPTILTTEVATKVTMRMKPFVQMRPWQWESKEEAKEFFDENLPWSRWDKAIREVYVDHGMLHKAEGTELKTPAAIEAACYPNAEAQAYARDHFYEFAEKVPAHIILGTRTDFIPKPVQDDFVKYVDGHVQSIQWVKSGHMLIQENPKGCADAIRKILESSAVSGVPKAKL
ncbi:alpha/beta-hydrolase [Panus rudis PR-1116 ss-1]|nr:alpha/beta-hydrolase [Panus rudis PR-1116 ss-1]